MSLGRTGAFVLASAVWFTAVVASWLLPRGLSTSVTTSAVIGIFAAYLAAYVCYTLSVSGPVHRPSLPFQIGACMLGAVLSRVAIGLASVGGASSYRLMRTVEGLSLSPESPPHVLGTFIVVWIVPVVMVLVVDRARTRWA